MGENEGEVWEGGGGSREGREDDSRKGGGEGFRGRVGREVVPGEGERGLGERVPGKGVGGTVPSPQVYEVKCNIAAAEEKNTYN